MEGVPARPALIGAHRAQRGLSFPGHTSTLHPMYLHRGCCSRELACLLSSFLLGAALGSACLPHRPLPCQGNSCVKCLCGRKADNGRVEASSSLCEPPHCKAPWSRSRAQSLPCHRGEVRHWWLLMLFPIDWKQLMNYSACSMLATGREERSRDGQTSNNADVWMLV